MKLRYIVALAIISFYVLGCANNNISSNNKDVRLIEAVRKQDSSLVQQLINAGVDIDTVIPGRSGTALISAVKTKNIVMVRLLLSNGANVNLINNDGESPLLFAAYQGDENLIKILLKAGANPNQARKRFKIAPLHVAAARGEVVIIRALIENKANVNLPAEAGVTALRIAREFDHDEVINLLQQAGAK